MFNPSFDELRGVLERQYDEPSLDEASGLSPEELDDAVVRYLAAHPCQPAILSKAELFAYLLDNCRIKADDFEFIVDKYDQKPFSSLRRRLSEGVWQALEPQLYPTHGFIADNGYISAGLDTSHTSPNWRNLFEYGFAGLRDIALARLENDSLSQPRRDFYTAVATVYGGVCRFALRLASAAEKHGTERMRFVAADLRHIAAHPPETFHQAIQLAHLYHQLQESEGEPLRSMGGFDRLYYRFYRHDLDCGLFTRDQLKEFTKYFFFKYTALYHGAWAGKNFMFAGLDCNGNDCVNDLSRMALEVFDEISSSDAKFSIRVADTTPRDYLRCALDCVRRGKSNIVFVSDRVAVDTLLRHGKTLPDARDLVLIGCYEPAVMGEEIMCSGAGHVNAAKAVEFALFDGFDLLTGERRGLPVASSLADFDGFMAEYKRQLAEMIRRTLHNVRVCERAWSRINPSPLLSGSMDGCLACGRDLSDGGARYNTSGVNVTSLGSAADSLCALKTLVYDRRETDLDGMRAALRDNWNGHELLRARALKCDKWGNNRALPDALAKEIYDYACSLINEAPNARGGDFQVGLWSIDHNVGMGQHTAALPDGHIPGESLSKNCCAVTAMDREGVTAMIDSAVKLDYTKAPNGSVLDLVLHRSAVNGEDGLEAFLSLMLTYFDQGGFALNFNVLDAETLKKAMADPDSYRNLQIRVCGFNFYFVNMEPTLQQDFIKQAEAGV